MLFAAGLVGLFKRRRFRCSATVHVDGAVHDHSPIIRLAQGTRQEPKDRIKTATTAARGRPLGDSMRTRSFPYLQGRTSMRRHILSRPTWRPYGWSSTTALCPSRYASIRILLVSLLFGDSVHCEIHLFGLLRRRCNLPIGLASSKRRVDQVRIAQSPYLDPKRSDTGKPHVSL